MTPLLEVRHLTVQFPANGNVDGPAGASATAVRDLTLTIAPQEVVGLVGESGSGKSVTSLAMMRLLPPQARATGEILYANGDGPSRDLLQLSGEQMRGSRGSQVARRQLRRREG